jgi:RNA polymerase sigma factor (sigma-70 family)
MAEGQLARVMRFLRRAAAPTSGEITDRQLLERFARERDEDAFTILTRRHAPMVLAVCQRVLGDVHAAEDAFQATFLVLARKAGSVRWQESVGGWLHEVALRVAQKARAEAAGRLSLESQVIDVPSPTTTPDVDRAELRAVLDQELASLPDKYRQPLVLCYLEGKTNEEAAQLLGWTKGSVSGQLARARELLRGRLAKRGVALSAGAIALAVSQSAAPAQVPAALLHSAVNAAILGSAATTAAAGAVAPSVAALAEGVLKTMFVTKLKMAALVFLVLGVAVTGTGWLTYRHWGGGDAVAAANLVPVPNADAPKPDEPKASPAVAVNGLSVTVKPAKRLFAPDQTLVFTVRFENTSKKDFTFLYTPTNYLGWKFSFKGTDGIADWLAENTAKREGFSTEPAVLRAGQALDADVRVDNGFLFTWKGPQRQSVGPRRSLPVGEYRLTMSFACRGTTENVKIAKFPPLWVGEITTRSVEFEVGEQKATRTTSQEVRVNGVEFQAQTDKLWLTPEPGRATEINLGLRITNRTDKPLTFAKSCGSFQLKDGNGQQLRGGYARDGIRALLTVALATGESLFASDDGRLTWEEGGKKLQLQVFDSTGGVRTFHGLEPGKYSFTFAYERTAQQDGWWVGKAQTEPLEIEIAKPLAAVPDQNHAIALAKPVAEKALREAYAAWAKKRQEQIAAMPDGPVKKMLLGSPKPPNDPQKPAPPERVWIGLGAKAQVTEEPEGGWRIHWKGLQGSRTSGSTHDVTVLVDRAGAVKVVSAEASDYNFRTDQLLNPPKQ